MGRKVLHQISITSSFLMVSAVYAVLIALPTLMVPSIWDSAVKGIPIIALPIIICSIIFAKKTCTFSSPHIKYFKY